MKDSAENRQRSTPFASSSAARKRMKAVRHKGTAAELALREVLDNHGLSYQTNAQPLCDLRREADVLFPTEKIAVFVDGCFWHGCPIHGTRAKSNARFWAEKIERNIARDIDTYDRLRKAGWKVVRIWEHEDPEEAGQTIISLLRQQN